MSFFTAKKNYNFPKNWVPFAANSTADEISSKLNGYFERMADDSTRLQSAKTLLRNCNPELNIGWPVNFIKDCTRTLQTPDSKLALVMQLEEKFSRCSKRQMNVADRISAACYIGTDRAIICLLASDYKGAASINSGTIEFNIVELQMDSLRVLAVEKLLEFDRRLGSKFLRSMIIALFKCWERVAPAFADGNRASYCLSIIDSHLKSLISARAKELKKKQTPELVDRLVAQMASAPAPAPAPTASVLGKRPRDEAAETVDLTASTPEPPAKRQATLHTLANAKLISSGVKPGSYDETYTYKLKVTMKVSKKAEGMDKVDTGRMMRDLMMHIRGPAYTIGRKEDVVLYCKGKHASFGAKPGVPCVSYFTRSKFDIELADAKEVFIDAAEEGLDEVCQKYNCPCDGVSLKVSVSASCEMGKEPIMPPAFWRRAQEGVSHDHCTCC